MHSKILHVFGLAFIVLSIFEAGSNAADHNFGNMAAQLLIAAFLASLFAVAWYQHHMELHEENEALHGRVQEEISDFFSEYFATQTDMQTKTVQKDAALKAMKVDAEKQDTRKKPATNIDGINRN